VASALAAGVVKEVLGTAEGLADLFTAVAFPSDVQVTQVAPHVLERLADVRTPQGIVAVATSTTTDLADVVGHGLLIVLDEVADPGNAGTILRTADAAGAAGVVATAGSADVFGPKAVRAAAGSTYHLSLVVDVDLLDVVAACRASGQAIFGLDASGQMTIDDLESREPPLALVLGNEAHGLSDAHTALMDDVVSIPIHGQAESLNVSAAAAIAIYLTARSVHQHVARRSS
jgi:TrmH family RNA methyltransferase